jgi:cation:H+ antiporter
VFADWDRRFVEKGRPFVVTVLILLFGLVVLSLGAEMLVTAAVKIAQSAGISSLVIGLTVVAFGTSAPELVVSLQSAWRGQADVALGNVVGSNIFNVLVILGLSAIIVPLAVAKQLIWVDVPLMILLTAGVWGMASDGQIGRGDGVLLTAGLFAYVAVALWQGRRQHARSAAAAATTLVAGQGGSNESPVENPSSATKSGRGLPWIRNLIWLGVGLAFLGVGAHYFIEAAVDLARIVGVSELVIGLTIVAAGTSLPEVATSIMAAIRGERDIAVGNVVGSNIFNLLAVLGISSMVSPAGVQVSRVALGFDLPVMMLVALVCLPIFWGGAIGRARGALLLTAYLFYLAYLLGQVSPSGGV